MEMTLNVKITGLDNLVAVLEKMAAVGNAPTQSAQIVMEVPAAQVTPLVPVTAAPVAPPVSAPPVTAVPTAPVSYSLDDLSLAAAQLVDANRMPELVNLLQVFGVQALTQLSPDRYGAFATQLRTLGAKL